MKKQPEKKPRPKKVAVSALRQWLEPTGQDEGNKYKQTLASYKRWEGTLLVIPAVYFFFSLWLQVVEAEHLWLIQMVLQFITILCLTIAVGFAQKLRFDWSWERFYIPVIFCAVGLFLGPMGGSALREYELSTPRTAIGYFDHSDGSTSVPGRGRTNFSVRQVYAKFVFEGKEYVRLCTQCSLLEKDKPVVLKIGRHSTYVLAEDSEKTEILRRKRKR